MKITRNTHTGKVPLNTIQPGQVFEYGRRIFMKIELTELPHRKATVALNTGKDVKIAETAMVRKVSANLKVSY